MSRGQEIYLARRRFCTRRWRTGVPADTVLAAIDTVLCIRSCGLLQIHPSRLHCWCGRCKLSNSPLQAQCRQVQNNLLRYAHNILMSQPEAGSQRSLHAGFNLCKRSDRCHTLCVLCAGFTMVTFAEGRSRLVAICERPWRWRLATATQTGSRRLQLDEQHLWQLPPAQMNQSTNTVVP